MLEARRRGAHIVVVDPVRTRTAAQADEHLAPLPGTDAALALALMHVVVRDGAHDEAFLRDRTEGWEHFRERVMAHPPERAAALCDLPAERIEALGRRLATTRPTAIRATMGIQRHAGGGMTLRTLAAIPAVTGDWQLAGRRPLLLHERPFKGDTAALQRADLRPHPVRTLSHTRLGEILHDADPAVRALVVYGANPLASNPDTTRIRRGLAREDLFTVVIEQSPTDTTDFADLVLPSTMQTEHMDVQDGYGHLYVAWNEPAVAPRRRVPPAHGDLAPPRPRHGPRRARPLRRRPHARAHAASESGDPTLEGITVERLRRDGWARLGHPNPLVPFADGFPTPSGRMRLPEEEPYIPPAEGAAPGEDRLALIAGASHWFLNSMFANAPAQLRRAGAPARRAAPRRRGGARARGRRRGRDRQRARRRSARASSSARRPAAASPRRPRATGRSCSPAARTSTPWSRSATPTSAAGRCSTTARSGSGPPRHARRRPRVVWPDGRR